MNVDIPIPRCCPSLWRWWGPGRRVGASPWAFEPWMFEAKSEGFDGEREPSSAPSFQGAVVVRQEMAGVLERNPLGRRLRTSKHWGEFQYGSGQLLSVRSSVWLVGSRRVEDAEREAEVHGRKIGCLGFQETRSSGQFAPERSLLREYAWYRSRGRVRGWSCEAKRSSYRKKSYFEG